MRVEYSRRQAQHPQEYARGVPKGAVKANGGIAEANRRLNRPGRSAWNPKYFQPQLRSSRHSTSAGNDQHQAARVRLPEQGPLDPPAQQRVDAEKNFYFQGGVTSYVRHLNRRRDRARRPADLRRAHGRGQLRGRAPVRRRVRRDVLAFADDVDTIDGTPSVASCPAALRKLPEHLAAKVGLAANLSGDDVREGLTGVSGVKLASAKEAGPRPSSATRTSRASSRRS